METNRWRNAGKPIRIGKIHVGWYALILIWFVHMTWVTFVGIVSALALLGYLGWKNKPPSLLLRSWRAKLKGDHLTGRPWWYRRN